MQTESSWLKYIIGISASLSIVGLCGIFVCRTANHLGAAWAKEMLDVAIELWIGPLAVSAFTSGIYAAYRMYKLTEDDK